MTKILKKDYVAFLNFANNLIFPSTDTYKVGTGYKTYEVSTQSGKHLEISTHDFILVGNLCYSVFFRFDCPTLHKQNFHFCGTLAEAKSALELHLKYLLAK